jgi:hypothetical protein
VSAEKEGGSAAACAYKPGTRWRSGLDRRSLTAMSVFAASDMISRKPLLKYGRTL